MADHRVDDPGRTRLPITTTTTSSSSSSPTNTIPRLSTRFKSLSFSFRGGKRSTSPDSSSAGAYQDDEGGVGVLVGNEGSGNTSTTSLISTSISVFGPGSGSSQGSSSASVMTSMSEGSSDNEELLDDIKSGKEDKKGDTTIQVLPPSPSPCYHPDEGMRTPSALQPTFNISHPTSSSLLETSSKSSPSHASPSSTSTSTLTSPSAAHSRPSSPSFRVLSSRYTDSTTSLDDMTPRAEMPPVLGITSVSGDGEGVGVGGGGGGGGGKKKTSPLKGGLSGSGSEEQGYSSQSRNGTIKRRSHTPDLTSTIDQHRRSSSNSTNNRSTTSRDSYFPSLDDIDIPSNSEVSWDSSDTESRRSRGVEPIDAEISPLSTELEPVGGMGGDHLEKYPRYRRQVSDDDYRRQVSDDDCEPWPSSLRHGPTPIGFGGLGPMALSPADVDAKASGSGSRGGGGGFSVGISTSTPSDPGMSMMSGSSASWANKTLEEYAYAAHEGVDTFTSGCEISTPLSPPPGYPMMIKNNNRSSSGDRRSTSQSQLSWGSNPGSKEGSPTTSPSVDGDPRGSISSSYSTSSGASGPLIPVESMSRRSSFNPSPISEEDHQPEVLADPTQNQSSNPFEGTITIDTNPQRYLISAKLEGFRVEDITIAVKSVNPSSSSASKSSVSSRNSMLIDNNSRRSSSASSRSRDGARDGFAKQGVIPEKGDAQAGITGPVGNDSGHRGKAGKVLHLLADRWDDSAHFERRITFGVDADFSGGVKAKFDGSVLNIEVPRRPGKRYNDRLSMASPSTSDPPNFDMRSSSFRGDKHGIGSFLASTNNNSPFAAHNNKRRTSAWDLAREERYAAAKMMDWQAHSDVLKNVNEGDGE